MAERFEMPKRFSAKWWSYFWEYYKWYVIVAVCVIAAVVYTVVQIKSQPKYLFNITYAGEQFFPEEVLEPFKESLTEGIGDDEENDGILFSQLNFDNSDTADAQYQSAMFYKLQIEFTTDETMLFLFDKSKLEEVTTSESTRDIWVPVSEWAEEPTENTYTDYGVCLKDSKLLKDNNINGENLYVAVRYNYDKDKDNEESAKRFNYSVQAANKLIKQ